MSEPKHISEALAGVLAAAVVDQCPTDLGPVMSPGETIEDLRWLIDALERRHEEVNEKLRRRSQRIAALSELLADAEVEVASLRAQLARYKAIPAGAAMQPLSLFGIGPNGFTTPPGLRTGFGR